MGLVVDVLMESAIFVTVMLRFHHSSSNDDSPKIVRDLGSEMEDNARYPYNPWSSLPYRVKISPIKRVVARSKQCLKRGYSRMYELAKWAKVKRVRQKKGDSRDKQKIFELIYMANFDSIQFDKCMNRQTVIEFRTRKNAPWWTTAFLPPYMISIDIRYPRQIDFRGVAWIELLWLVVIWLEKCKPAWIDVLHHVNRMSSFGSILPYWEIKYSIAIYYYNSAWEKQNTLLQWNSWKTISCTGTKSFSLGKAPFWRSRICANHLEFSGHPR